MNTTSGHVLLLWPPRLHHEQVIFVPFLDNFSTWGVFVVDSFTEVLAGWLRLAAKLASLLVGSSVLLLFSCGLPGRETCGGGSMGRYLYASQ